ncbi:MAG: ion channel [Bacteroidota bacterium]
MNWNRLNPTRSRSSGLPSARSGASNSSPQADLGLGDKVGQEAGTRLIQQDGSFNVERRGSRIFHLYFKLVEMPWRQFLLVVLLFYLAINIFFGCLFWLFGPGQIAGFPPGEGWFHELSQCFFLSVQTFTTVGFGAIHPVATSANFLSAIVALVGLISVAMATGLFFARFSRPRQLIVFSTKAVIAPYGPDALNSLQFRIANQRDDNLINLQASVTLTWLERDEKSGLKRRFAPLELERDGVALFPLNWTIVHVIDEDSPLIGWEKAAFCLRQSEIIISIQGYDDAFAQTIHANSSYTFEEVIWGARFLPMYHEEDGTTVLELDCIDKIEHL